MGSSSGGGFSTYSRPSPALGKRRSRSGQDAAEPHGSEDLWLLSKTNSRQRKDPGISGFDWPHDSTGLHRHPLQVIVQREAAPTDLTRTLMPAGLGNETSNMGLILQDTMVCGMMRCKHFLWFLLVKGKTWSPGFPREGNRTPIENQTRFPTG